MKFRTLCALFLAAVLTLSALAGCVSPETQTSSDSSSSSKEHNDQMGENNGISEFRPVDCGLAAQEDYSFPFLGLNMVLTDALLAKMTSKEVFVFTQEDYTADYKISYGVLRFSLTTEADRTADTGLSADIFAFEAALEKIGAIGVYEKSVVSQLDELTACDTHTKFGASADGTYEYYISIHSQCGDAMVAELKASVLSISEMHTFDPSLGYTAFSSDRVEGVANVGKFETKDVFGESKTQDIFAEYDLTLVNVFATWCNPCVEEMPELEKLRKEYADRGIKLGVVAIVLDAKTASGAEDEGAIALAQTLHERSGAQFPFLIPDEGNLNGRLTGIESIPESFFVDSSGNIVSEAYVGAHTQSEWEKIVEAELAKQ